jgi:hypothetical protein
MHKCGKDFGRNGRIGSRQECLIIFTPVLPNDWSHDAGLSLRSSCLLGRSRLVLQFLSMVASCYQTRIIITVIVILPLKLILEQLTVFHLRISNNNQTHTIFISRSMSTKLWLSMRWRPYVSTRHATEYVSSTKLKKKQSYPCNRPWRPIGLWDVEAPTSSRQSAHTWR